MIWLENHDIVLLREILHIQPWSQRHGSVERGQLWDKIAVVLNSLEGMNFKVTTRSVRDRYTLLVKKYKKKMEWGRKSEWYQPKAHINRWCFIWIDSTIWWGWLRKEKIIWREKREEGRRSGQGARNKKKFLKTFGETRKRKAESEKKTCRSTSGTINFLAEKSERKHELQKEELKLRKQEIENQTQQIQNAQLAQQAQPFMLQQQGSLMMEIFLKFCWQWNQKVNYGSSVDKKKRRLFSDYVCSVVVVLFKKCKE